MFNYRTTILSDDFDLLEGLTTGHFDAKNRLVRKISFGILRSINMGQEVMHIEMIMQILVCHSNHRVSLLLFEEGVFQMGFISCP